MPIVPFNIVNPDGSINQSEYERCISFLNDYTNGLVKVYPETTWANPLEVDMSRNESALEILSRYILYNDNKLLNKSAYNDIKKLFHGILERYGSTIHTYGKYLEQSKNFIDGPGYKYDVFTPAETEVKTSQLNNDITIYYLDDENHTVLEYNDTAYSNSNIDNLPTTNFPQLNLDKDNHYVVANINSYPNVYKGYLCGIYSDFQRLSGQYVGSSTLFYHSMCNDILYTTGADSYNDNRLGEIVNFNYRATVYDKTKPARGVDLSLISASRNALVNSGDVNAYINPTVVNPSVSYIAPTFFTAEDITDWLI